MTMGFFHPQKCFLGASTNPTVCVVMSWYFTLHAGHCLCASVQRPGLQLLEALQTLLTHGFP